MEEMGHYKISTKNEIDSDLNLPKKVPILMYHEIIGQGINNNYSQKIQGSYLVHKDNFEEQMRYLRENNYSIVSLDDLVNNQKRASCVSRPIVITFDDGFVGNFYFALPILKKYDFSATFFITAGGVGTQNMLNWDQIRYMHSKGMSIQSHSYTHPFLSTLSEKKLKFELLNSKSEIEDQTGGSVDFISYPNGDYNHRVVRLVRKYGYRAACTSNFGFNNGIINLFCLKRIKISGSYDISYLSRILDCSKEVCLYLRVKDAFLYILKRILGSKQYAYLYSKIFDVEI